jgi:thioesterase domain-containing protein
LVALELARELERQGARVGLLVLLDTSYPQTHRGPRPCGGVWSCLWSAGRSLRWLATGCASAVASRVGRTVPQRRREFWFREARRRALRQYVPQAYPGRITYFLAEDSDRHKTLLHWRALAGAGLDLRVVGGDHASLFFPEHTRRLAATLGACLAEAQARSRSESRLRPAA